MLAQWRAAVLAVRRACRVFFIYLFLARVRLDVSLDCDFVSFFPPLAWSLVRGVALGGFFCTARAAFVSFVLFFLPFSFSSHYPIHTSLLTYPFLFRTTTRPNTHTTLPASHTAPRLLSRFLDAPAALFGVHRWRSRGSGNVVWAERGGGIGVSCVFHSRSACGMWGGAGASLFPFLCVGVA